MDTAMRGRVRGPVQALGRQVGTVAEGASVKALSTYPIGNQTERLPFADTP